MANKTTHPSDIIEVKNILTNDNTDMTEVVRTSRRVQDPETGLFSTEYYENIIEWNTADFFQVFWDGKPFRIAPGQTRLMPRHIAEHFAKHLANFVLGKEEMRTGKKGLVQSKVRRPQVLAQILVRVVDYYEGDTFQSEGDRALNEVERLNKDEEARAINLGVVPPTAVGVLKDEPLSTEEIMKNAAEASEEDESGQMADPPPPPGQEENNQTNGHAPVDPDAKPSIFDPDKPKPTRQELVQEAMRLGIEITGKENYSRLETLIKRF